MCANSLRGWIKKFFFSLPEIDKKINKKTTEEERSRGQSVFRLKKNHGSFYSVSRPRLDRRVRKHDFHNVRVNKFPVSDAVPESRLTFDYTTFKGPFPPFHSQLLHMAGVCLPPNVIIGNIFFTEQSSQISQSVVCSWFSLF